jgi:hypothetical protein
MAGVIIASTRQGGMGRDITGAAMRGVVALAGAVDMVGMGGVAAVTAAASMGAAIMGVDSMVVEALTAVEAFMAAATVAAASMAVASMVAGAITIDGDGVGRSFSVWLYPPSGREEALSLETICCIGDI